MLALLAIGHALAVFILWWLAMKMDQTLVPAALWLILAWVWVIWPFVLAAQIRRAPIRTLTALGMSALLLAPCAPTVFAFTAWTISGFAP